MIGEKYVYFLREICFGVEMDLCLESGAINLISLLKETNGILSIIPDFGRIYNLFAPKSIESKSWLNFSNMCFLRSKNMKAILGLVLAVPPTGLELFTLPSH